MQISDTVSTTGVDMIFKTYIPLPISKGLYDIFFQIRTLWRVYVLRKRDNKSNSISRVSSYVFSTHVEQILSGSVDINFNVVLCGLLQFDISLAFVIRGVHLQY